MENQTETNVTNATPEEIEAKLESILFSYKYLMPGISTIGIIGNVIALLVLTSKELHVTKNRQRISQRSQSMFSFMKALAIVDIFELLWTYQGAFFSVNGYWRFTLPSPIPSKSMAIYIWNFMEPIWRIFMHSSDFILVVMTIVRFQIVNSAHQYKASMPGGAAKYHCYTIFAFMLSLLLNLPHMVHYKIVECPEIENCWTIEQSDVAESIFWKILGYLTVFVAKILPLFIITIVDIIIFVKIKKIYKKRQKFRSTRRNAGMTIASETEIFDRTTADSNNMELQSLEGEPITRAAKIIHKKREKENQLKLTKILLLLGLLHFLTTILETVVYFMITVYQNVWKEFSLKAEFATAGNVLNNVNYAKNFYLYCFVHEDIRRIAFSKITFFIRKLKCW